MWLNSQSALSALYPALMPSFASEAPHYFGTNATTSGLSPTVAAFSSYDSENRPSSASKPTSVPQHLQLQQQTKAEMQKMSPEANAARSKMSPSSSISSGKSSAHQLHPPASGAKKSSFMVEDILSMRDDSTGTTAQPARRQPVAVRPIVSHSIQTDDDGDVPSPTSAYNGSGNGRPLAFISKTNSDTSSNGPQANRNTSLPPPMDFSSQSPSIARPLPLYHPTAGSGAGTGLTSSPRSGFGLNEASLDTRSHLYRQQQPLHQLGMLDTLWRSQAAMAALQHQQQLGARTGGSYALYAPPDPATVASAAFSFLGPEQQLHNFHLPFPSDSDTQAALAKCTYAIVVRN
jgi:hypothetical protein